MTILEQLRDDMATSLACTASEDDAEALRCCCFCCHFDSVICSVSGEDVS